MENLNLIRDTAWKFHRSTRIEFEELFGEASLAYVIAIQSYDETKNTKLSTWAVYIMKNHLINFCKKQQHENKLICDWDENIITKQEEQSNYEKEIIFTEWKETLPSDLQLICQIISTDSEVLSKTPKATRGCLVKKLREEKEWTWGRIWNSIRNIKLAINEI